MFRIANYIESGVWVLVAFGITWWGFKRADWQRKPVICAAFVLVAFGASDIVEADTGAWWRPWWLLLWKAMCIIMFLATMLRVRKRQK